MKLHGFGPPPAAQARRLGARRGAGRGCPLQLWRERDPSGIAPDDVAALERALASIAILDDRGWPAARAGDPAAAAAAAIGGIRRGRLEEPLADIVMGNLVLLARKGDATAPMLLAHALGTLARRHPGRPRLARLAAAWAGRRSTGGRGSLGRCP